ncbi:tetratricopeptide repeat protein [Actinacidiphila acididurans]|uniref:Tetratricopeptide repeat protein n=1 Tax=Actinacidiphila acididurans TaxID=2784346 RepID=A0ABS2TK75_9ACTN|nr:tetratricopeptide repeat protein [Actinacidiphila acididurans]MBM9503734.1 tetratricopeptide repeat protein [Actinacidiphila acididurans]
MQPRNMSMSGVVDLAAVKAASEAKAKAEQARAQRQSGDAGAAPASPLVIEVTEETFESDVLQRSAEVPVVISFWADQAEQSKQLNTVLTRLAGQYRGRFVLATADVYANQLLFQQFGVQGVPAVFAVLAGQAMPLFQGAAPEPQIAEVLDQLIAVAEQRFGIVGPEVDAQAVPEAEPEPPRLPTAQELALSAGHDALDAGDLGGAIQAYKNVLADEPANIEAKLGLAQAELLNRVQGADPAAVRAAAAERPTDVQAQLAAADLDLVGGHVEDAFSRLVDTVRRTFGDDRDTARLRLLDLFEVIGPDDPRVTAARAALARVLF